MFEVDNSIDDADHHHVAMTTSAEIYYDWGVRLLKAGQTADATLAFEQAVRLRPAWADARKLAGVALRLQGRLEEAIEHSREAVRLAPDMAEAHNNLGSMLEESGCVEESIVSLREALRLRPDFANAYSNLGIALYRQSHYAEALALYRQAITLDPGLAEAHHNLGNVLFDLGQSDEALTCFSTAIRLRPHYREPHLGRARIWLSRGEFELGWREFEWRLSPHELRRCRQPRWDGSELAGRTILLDTEQGLGDTLQFVRYGALLQEMGANVLLACQPRLARLLAAGCPVVDQVVPQGESAPAFDVYCPLLSLPGLLRTNLANVPVEIPYIKPDPSLVESWRVELSRLPGFKIGIAWQGSVFYRGDRERSIPLAEFERLALVPGVTLISLQKGAGLDQLPDARRRFPLVDFGNRVDEQAGAFLDTAAIMMSLDLVVACDSAVCHLAGALGVPAWVALSSVPDWRWLLNREDSPWYPSLRLFRQHEPGNWSEVFERMASAVNGHITAQ